MSKIGLKIKKYGLLPILILIWLVYCITVLSFNKIEYFPTHNVDGQSRAVLGAKWIEKPFLINSNYSFNSIWLPFQYWLIGLGLKLFYDLYWVPIIINLLFSVGIILMLYEICWLFFKNRLVCLIAVILASFLPWFTWLSTSALSEPIAFFFIIAAFYFYFKWLSELNKVSFLFLSGIMQFFGNMTRVNNWSFSVIFAISTLAIFIKNRSVFNNARSRKILSLTLVFPWIFPLIWEIAQYLEFHTLLLYWELCRKESLLVYNFSIWERMLKFIKVHVAVSPVICFLSMIGGFRILFKKKGIYILYFAIVLSYSISVLLLFLSGANPFSPERIIAISLLLLSPFAAKFIYDGFRLNRQDYNFMKGVLLIGLLFIMLNHNIRRTYAFPFIVSTKETMCTIGQRLRIFWQEGILKEDEQVLIKARKGDECFSYQIIAAYSNHPFNINSLGYSISENQAGKIIKKFRIVVVHSDFYQDYALKFKMNKCYKIDEYYLFVSGLT